MQPNMAGLTFFIILIVFTNIMMVRFWKKDRSGKYEGKFTGDGLKVIYSLFGVGIICEVIIIALIGYKVFHS